MSTGAQYYAYELISSGFQFGGDGNVYLICTAKPLHDLPVARSCISIGILSKQERDDLKNFFKNNQIMATEKWEIAIENVDTVLLLSEVMNPKQFNKYLNLKVTGINA